MAALPSKNNMIEENFVNGGKPGGLAKAKLRRLAVPLQQQVLLFVDWTARLSQEDRGGDLEVRVWAF